MSNKFHGLCTLVVDDSALMRDIMRSMLDNLGIGRVLVSSTGQDALNILGQDKVDIVFCDWKMEPMDGITLIERIRDISTCPTPGIPVIMTSGFAGEFPMTRGWEAGMTDFVAKPLTAQTLYQRLDHFIEDPSEFAQGADDPGDID